MTLRRIAQIGHPILRRPAAPVPEDQIPEPWVQSLVQDLVETMREAGGAGLAAPQIHEPWQVCVMEVGENARYPYMPRVPLTVLINPEITPLSSETYLNYEGCLSVPNLRGRVGRYTRIHLKAFDASGGRIDREVAGITAGTLQHEVDHLFATLFVDRVTDPLSLTTWDQFARYRETAFREAVRSVVDRFGS